MPRPLVRVEGLNQFRRTLRQMDRNLPKELAKDLQKAAETLVAPTRELLPEKSGRLRRSVRVMRGTGKTAVGSYEPYSNFIYWGGSTGRGHVRGKKDSGAVKLKPKTFDVGGEPIQAAHPAVHQAAHEHEQQLLRDFERAFQEFARRNGFR